MKEIILLGGTLMFYTFHQEIPRFKLNYWRWKKLSGTFEFGIILFGRWFICHLEHDLFLDEEFDYEI